MSGSLSINVEIILAQTVKYNLPDATKLLSEYLKIKTDEAHKQLIINMVDTYFMFSKREDGKKLLGNASYNHKSLDVWLADPFWQNFDSQFAPLVPTLIINGEYDRLCPCSIFYNDTRFIKPNINIFEIRNAGHFPWIEQPSKVKIIISKFVEEL